MCPCRWRSLPRIKRISPWSSMNFWRSPLLLSSLIMNVFLNTYSRAMNSWTQMQGGQNWILPKEINANRFFWDSYWLEIWKNQLCPSFGPDGGSAASATENNRSPTLILTHQRNLSRQKESETFFTQWCSWYKDTEHTPRTESSRCFSDLKGLSHEIDFKNFDKNLQNLA